MRLPQSTVNILRRAGFAKSYSHLEETVNFDPLRAAIRMVVDRHDELVRRAEERKAARRWRPEEDELLRCRFRDGASVGHIADELERTPKSVENRLVALGMLRLRNIRRGGVQTASLRRVTHLSKAEQERIGTDAGGQRVFEKAATDDEDSSVGASIDSDEDELLDLINDAVAEEALRRRQ